MTETWTLRGTYIDHGSSRDNAGRNTHYAGVEWSGPRGENRAADAARPLG